MSQYRKSSWHIKFQSFYFPVSYLHSGFSVPSYQHFGQPRKYKCDLIFVHKSENACIHDNYINSCIRKLLEEYNTDENISGYLLRSFNGLEPGGLESMIRK